MNCAYLGCGIRRLASRYPAVSHTYIKREIEYWFVCIFDSLFLQERVMIHKKPFVSVQLPALIPINQQKAEPTK